VATAGEVRDSRRAENRLTCRLNAKDGGELATLRLNLQAEGHRFDPGTLHSKVAAKRLLLLAKKEEPLSRC
jgi:hypothetical protein